MSDEIYTGEVKLILLPKGKAGRPKFEGLQAEVREFLTKKQRIGINTAGMNVAKVTGKVVAAQNAGGASEETVDAAMSESLEVDVATQAVALVAFSTVRWRIGEEGEWFSQSERPLEDSVDDVTHDAMHDEIDEYYDPSEDAETFPGEGVGVTAGE